MSEKQDILSELDNEINALNSKKIQHEKIKKFGNESALSGIVMGAFLLAAQWGVSHLYDKSEYDAVEEKINSGRFVVPREFYEQTQEKCIHTVIKEQSDMDIKALPHDVVQTLKEKFSDKIEENCSDALFSKDTQHAYLESLAPPSWPGSIGSLFLMSSTFYFGISLYGGLRRRSAEKALRKRQRDHDLLL